MKIMPITRDEVETIATDLSQSHSEQVIQLAAMQHIIESLMTSFGKSNEHDMTRHMRSFRNCVHAYLKDQRIDPRQIQSATTDLKRAALNTDYLDKLPD